jgi:hypothetical protein
VKPRSRRRAGAPALERERLGLGGQTTARVKCRDKTL